METGPQNYRVTSDYEVSYKDPLRLQAGETVEILKVDERWPGWAWVKTSGDDLGWLPLRLLEVRGASQVVLAAFDGTEISARAGERLQVLQDEGGWFWCRKADGEEGWFPAFSLRREEL
ncbi:MAG: hypothetical protein JJU20_04120 [Opitutales bacterium]|nr:hypothetical protein [Opitutales bacterium]